MRKMLLSSVVLASFMACSSEKPAAAAAAAAPVVAAANDAHPQDQKTERERVDADGIARRGKPLSAEATMTVAEAAAKAKDLDGKSVKIAGTVESVCQPMGCWFVIQGAAPGESIRVMSKGHDVFMPRSSAGRDVVAEGEFKVKTVSKEMAQHFEDERELKDGETRKVFTADVQELSLALTAAELQPKKS